MLANCLVFMLYSK